MLVWSLPVMRDGGKMGQEWAKVHPPLSPAELGLQFGVLRDCHTGRATEFINYNRAEVQNTRRWIRMFSTVRGAGKRWMSVEKWIQKFRARTVWARESTPRLREQVERERTELRLDVWVSQSGWTSSSWDRDSPLSCSHQPVIEVLTVAAMRSRTHF